MPPASALRFARLARRVGEAARAEGLVAPAFRSPPGLEGATRTIRRHPRGAVVAVRVRGRTAAAVAADLVDGVLAANGLGGRPAVTAARALHRALREAPVAGGAAGPGARPALGRRSARARAGRSVATAA